METGPEITNRRRVLVMEDDVSMAQLIRHYLGTRNFHVVVAPDAQTGLTLFAAEPFDMVLLDYRLPDRDGLEVLEDLKRITPHPPVIIMSGLGLERIAAEALKLGALDYVSKGAEGDFLENLMIALQEGLRKKAEWDQLRDLAEERERWMSDLQQRVRELGCLYGIEKLLAGSEEPSTWLLASVANLVAGACSSRGRCGVRIRAGELQVTSKDWKDTPWKRAFPLRVRGRDLGEMEAGWVELRPGADTDTLFTENEEDLLQSVADRFAVYLDRWHSARDLAATQDELRKLYRAVEQGATAVMITDAEGRIEYVNPAFTTMTGYTREEVLGQTPRILKSGRKKLEEYAELWRIIKSGKEWRGEFHNRRKDGTLYWDYSIITPITDACGDVTHFVAVKQDITADKNAERWREGVLRISAQVAGCDTEDAICRTVVEGIREWMDVDRCGLFLARPNDLAFRGTYGTDMEGRTVDEHDRVWDIRRHRDVEDLFAVGTYKSGFPLGNPEPTPEEEGLTATLIALRHRGEVFGVISVDNRIRRQNVSEPQIVHVALLAEVIGNALQAARTREALRRLLEQQQRALAEIELFNRSMIGRENRIIELKEEVNRLLQEMGRPPRYEPVWLTGEAPESPEGQAP